MQLGAAREFARILRLFRGLREVQGENSLLAQLSVRSNAAARGEALNKLVFALVHNSIYIPSDLTVNFSGLTQPKLSARRCEVLNQSQDQTPPSVP